MRRRTVPLAVLLIIFTLFAATSSSFASLGFLDEGWVEGDPDRPGISNELLDGIGEPSEVGTARASNGKVVSLLQDHFDSNVFQVTVFSSGGDFLGGTPVDFGLGGGDVYVRAVEAGAAGYVYVLGKVDREVADTIFVACIDSTTGELNGTFGDGGVMQFENDNALHAATLAPDGDFIFAGSRFNESTATNIFSFMRIDVEGLPAEDWGTANGTFETELPEIYNAIGGLAFDEADRLLFSYVADFEGDGVARIGRLNNTGTAYSSAFGDEGIATVSFVTGDFYPYLLKVLPGGKMLVGGTVRPEAPEAIDTRFGAARVLSDGSLDETFSTDGKRLIQFTDEEANGLGAVLHEVLLRPAGGYILAGTVTDSSDGWPALARLNSDGSLATEFGTGGLTQTMFGNRVYQFGTAVHSATGRHIFVTGTTKFEDEGDDRRFVTLRYWDVPDLCANYAGHQNPVPTGYTRLTGGKCVPTNAAANTIYATAYADTLDARGGADKVYGRAGNDKLSGGSGGDLLDGESGKDTLIGGSGNDKLRGGTGNDKLYGGYGNDTFAARDGVKDVISCGPGTDTAYVDRYDYTYGCEYVLRG